MKPLDLQVNIQNSYEAARSEGVRLEKPHVAGMLANEDAQRDQVVRDQSVPAPEARNMQDDLFAADEYEHSDYADAGGAGKKKRQPEKKPEPDKVIVAEEEKQSDSENSGGFSTYA